MNYGDYPEDFTTVAIYFTTHDGNGAPVAPLTAFEADDIKIYKNGSNAQKTSTNGITMTSPFDSIVGLHCIVIDTSNDTGDSGFWTTGGGSVYTVILNPDTETVNGQPALKVIGTFGIALSPALRPTTAGRTLDVSATGEAGIDWGNVGAPTTTLALTGTTIATTQKVDVETIKTNPVVNGGTVTFPTTATLASTTNISAGTITTATNLTNAPTSGDFTATMKTSLNAATPASVGSVSGAIGSVGTGGITAASFAAGAIDAAAIADNAIDAGAIAASAITATKIATGAITSTKFAAGAIDAAAIATDAIDADALAADAITEIQSGLSTLTAAGVRTAIGLGAANLDTQLSTIDDFLDTEIAAIKAKTDNLPSDPSDASDIAAAFGTVNSTLATIATYIDTEVAAIKAKTDNLPASPAAVSDIPTADAVADALLDRTDAVEVGITPRQALRLTTTIVGAKLSGAGTGTEVFRNAVEDSKDRVTATVDSSGNRTAITYDLT